jgi:hypothetical protein
MKSMTMMMKSGMRMMKLPTVCFASTKNALRICYLDLDPSIHTISERNLATAIDECSRIQSLFSIKERTSTRSKSVL